MSTGKRALIVDDSRSARVILSRMLEQHGLAVDTAESAEQALEYLQQHRPDVIFMDHLMPGMDGFQAVQEIKGDAQTATIPLMMYTSQEGELYVSQARALGAIGVLPKTVRPADVSRVLYQLHLLEDRRQDRTTLFRRPGRPVEAVPSTAQFASPEEVPAPDRPAATPEPAYAATPSPAVSPAMLSEFSAGLRQSVQQLVKDQLAEQRRFVLATFEAFARRLGSEIREHAQGPPPPAVEPPPPEPPRRQWWPVLLTAILAVIPACVLGFMYWQELATGREIRSQVGRLEEKIGELAKARPPVASPFVAAAPVPAPSGDVAPSSPAAAGYTASRSGSTPASAPTSAPVDYVPYGDVPFGGTRLERLRTLAATLLAQGFRGRIVLEYSVGDFCLTGSPADGFDVADPLLPLKKCDIVGNPFDDSLSPAQRQTVDFANFAATLHRRSSGTITVDAIDAGRRSVIAYPEQTETTTAGAWNTVAAQNNRVETRVVSVE
jgi:CheY-like chemotaxis protein